MTIYRDVRSAGGRLTRTVRRQARRTLADYRQRRRGGAVRVEAGGRGNLVCDPVFVLCSPRSGSTLLRAILNTHSQICAPHELHLGMAQVRANGKRPLESWKALGFTQGQMENILWDRMLHLLLAESGKQIIVDKTPAYVLNWKRIAKHWPHARYIHLRRHPLRIVESRAAARPDQTTDFQISRTLLYCTKLDEARAALPGPTLRYEDLTTDPAGQMQRVCSYLGVEWEPQMLHYRQEDFRVGRGDWSDNIRSGQIVPAKPAPPIEQVPVDLRGVAIAWGYG